MQEHTTAGSPASLLTLPPCPTCLRAAACLFFRSRLGRSLWPATQARMASPEHPYIQPRDLQHLPAAVLSHTFSFLPPNERTLTTRFVCRDTAAAPSDAEAHTASLSQPLPAHAAPWDVEAGQQHVRQLPLQHKLQLLSTAAASGSEVNLEVALALLRPSIFSEMLITGHDVWEKSEVLPDPGPGVAAIEAGHPQVLGWLLRHCPALVCLKYALEAAGEHCDLAGLQGVWRVLNGEEQPVDWGGRSRPTLDQWALNGAAGSPIPDAVAKMEWVLGAAEEGSCSLYSNPYDDVAEAAARSGDLGRLRWLLERGCRLDDPESWVLQQALQYADMGVVQWLVDGAGWDLLGPQAEHKEYWGSLVAAAARGPDGLARVLWLQERGVVLKDGIRPLLYVVTAPGYQITVGQVHTLRYIMQRYSDDLGAQQLAQLGRGLTCAPVASGSIPLVEELRQSGVTLDHQSYYYATYDMEMTRWLVTEAKVSPRGLALWELFDPHWRGTPATNRELLEAVQLLVGAGAGARSGDVMRAILCAAERGNLPIVHDLAQHMEQQLGCQPDWHRAMQVAVESGCEALLEWLAGKAGCLANAGISYMPAVRAGDRGTLNALRRLGVPWGAGDVVVGAVEEGCQAPVLRWLLEQGAPMGSAAEMEEAVAAAEREGELGAEAAAWLRGLAEASRAQEAAAAAAAAAAGRVSLACPLYTVPLCAKQSTIAPVNPCVKQVLVTP